MTSERAGAAGGRDVAVIGAGIVGVSCALWLQRDGHRVTLYDRGEPGSGTSFGNAGAVAVGAAAPIVMPGMPARVPRMLLDPLGPLVLRWRYLPFILPWLLRLIRESRPERVEQISKDLTLLVTGAAEAWLDLAGQAGAEDLLRPVGWLKVYESDAGFAATLPERQLLDRRGIRYDLLNADELRQLEPGLAPIFRHAFLQPDSLFVTNPKRAVTSFAADFAARGGRIERAEVTGFDLDGGPRRIRVADGAPREAEVIVLACGAWSRGLARQLGARVPLDTERGYHLMLPHAEPGLRRPTVHGEQSFVLAPMEEGMRLTSQVELAGLDAPPDYRRIRRLLPLAKRMLPGLVAEERSAWLGFRPSLPDSKPVIAPSPRHRDVYFAFGHQHIGLTLGPVTGRLIADLVAARNPGIDLTPFRAER